MEFSTWNDFRVRSEFAFRTMASVEARDSMNLRSRRFRESVICKRENPIWRRTATNSESLGSNSRYFERGRNVRNGKAITLFRGGGGRSLSVLCCQGGISGKANRRVWIMVVNVMIRAKEIVENEMLGRWRFGFLVKDFTFQGFFIDISMMEFCSILEMEHFGKSWEHFTDEVSEKFWEMLTIEIWNLKLCRILAMKS